MSQKSIPVLQREINKLKKINAELRDRVMAVATITMRQALLDTQYQNEMRIQQLGAEIEKMQESEKKTAEKQKASKTNAKNEEIATKEEEE